MKFSTLVRTNSWLSLKQTFPNLYPKEKNHLDGYEQVFKSLLLLTPVPSKMSIQIQVITDDFDGEEYVHVSGIDKNDKGETSWAIEFVPWEEWLDMEMDEDSLKHFTEPEILCHCLYEMTFMGFDQKGIQSQLQEMNEDVEALKNMTEEERQKNSLSMDDLKKRLDISDEFKDEDDR